MAGCVPDLADGAISGSGPGLAGHVLLAGEAAHELRTAVEAIGATPHAWLRRAAGTGEALTWPPDAVSAGSPSGRYDAALVRLPRTKDELEMMLHAVAACVAPGGLITVYGANDEGIRSAPTRIEPLLGPVTTIAQRAHCRVLAARRPTDMPGLKASLHDWRQSLEQVIGGQPRTWVSYPGVFAKGGLDAGTRLLLSAFAPHGLKPEWSGRSTVVAPALTTAPSPPLAMAKTARVLDYGCGTGRIAAELQMLWPQATIEMVDWDAVAVLAAQDNVPGAGARTAARLSDLGAASYDLIVSNPPIHDGKSEDYTVLAQLIAEAPGHLTPKGSLVLVTLRRVPVDAWLSAAFSRVEQRLHDNLYAVWSASAPKSEAARIDLRDGS